MKKAHFFIIAGSEWDGLIVMSSTTLGAWEGRARPGPHDDLGGRVDLNAASNLRHNIVWQEEV